MSPELETKLRAMFPKIFERRGGVAGAMFARVGLQIDDGWFDLISCLCQRLQAETDQRGANQLFAMQVKEKFGGLRFYVAGGPSDRQKGAIGLAEAMSFRLCERCGNRGALGYRERVYSTRCFEHRLPGTASVAEPT